MFADHQHSKIHCHPTWNDCAFSLSLLTASPLFFVSPVTFGKSYCPNLACIYAESIACYVMNLTASVFCCNPVVVATRSNKHVPNCIIYARCIFHYQYIRLMLVLNSLQNIQVESGKMLINMTKLLPILAMSTGSTQINIQKYSTISRKDFQYIDGIPSRPQ